MARIKSLTLLAAAGAIFVAPAAGAREAHGPERGIDSLNQPQVERTDFIFDVAAPSGGLTPAGRQQLRSWFDSVGVGYGDRVFVDSPYGAADVASVAAEYGLLLSDGAPVTPGPVPPESIRVVISRTTAFVPECPQSDHYRGPSSTSPNYGCAVNSNWAAMVANPSDLVLGQVGAVGADGEAGTKAIRVYRQAAPTGTKGLNATNTRGGN
ncbi:MAG TPA: CpaD family pilus assembly lipoprotein [Allosphingosinicella sp.]|jgi:pilus assembly protein CpaD